ncbi:hypothetical protein GCM10010954_31660 [Halobacillus andaensis]|uniref:Uncharacterized protein n=1 Tax=Halobacillus andaensis TaxID=1176239 RepID=A0A917B8M3_HALAA|nr:hypothetical protein [Halobacillus andaensis]MBP2005272.1 hypothetical protein [Halobacillus andaensis]GGF30196.1 hypothetical protein GCM10010954_31660 [Halobacillus andaensis]
MKKNRIKILPILVVGLIPLIIALVLFLFNLSEQQAKRVVDDFYTYEQEGDFSSSWQLLHPYMKDKFTKGHYIQDRAHVFMNHFGVTTFSYEVEGAEKIKDWKMEEDRDALNEVYMMTVIQTYKGKYGHFDLYQKVYAAKEEGEWTILWDYNK